MSTRTRHTPEQVVRKLTQADQLLAQVLGGLVERSITADQLVDELDWIALGRGHPTVLRSDNGPELACSAMRD